MRIIAGTHRSRIILSPKDPDVTRPITDRVKVSLFDRLTSMAALDGAAVDIFAGTGSLGLEALSRGIDHVTFIERDRSARTLLEKNLDTLGFANRATVLGSDALGGAWVSLLPHTPVNLVFLDPPYAMMKEATEAARVMELIARLSGVVAPEGVLMLRTEGHVSPAAVAGWEGPASYPYGSMTLHFYQRPAV